MDAPWLHKDGRRLWRTPPNLASDDPPPNLAPDGIPDVPSSTSQWIYKDGRRYGWRHLFF